MAFFHLSTFGNPNDPDQCFIGGSPDGMGIHMYCMGLGERAAPHYPSPARIFLLEEHPGIRLTSLLGNVNSYLIASSALKGVIERHCEGVDIEYLPCDLHDHRRRLFSRDYFIVNPIGAVDCLDEAASVFLRGPDGSVLRVMRYVLHPDKVARAPSLFRMGEATTEYVVDGRLAKAIEAARFTNVILEPLEVSTR